MKACVACKGKGVVSWSSRHAADKDGRFSMSGEEMGEPRISVCVACHGTGAPRRAEIETRKVI